MLPTQFANPKAMLDYAEQNGLVYLWAVIERQQVLPPAFIEC
jgi:hypothetical protein